MICLMFGNDVNAQKSTSPYTNYSFDIEGDLPKEIKKKITNISTTAAFKDKKNTTRLAINRRLTRDQKKIGVYLKSIGYFDYFLDKKIRMKRGKARVTLTVKLGPQYNFGDIEFISDGDPLPDIDIPLEKGTVFSSTLLLKAEEIFLTHLSENGYPSPLIRDREIIQDSDRKIVSVLIYLNPGQKTRFGETQITVGNFVKKSFIQNRLKWCKGQIFNQEKLDESRDNLINTDIFDGVVVKAKSVEGAFTPIDVTLSERKRHYIGLGLDYSTEDGFGGKVFWGHRNLWNGGEQLKISYEHLQLKKGLEAELFVPDVLTVDQTWHSTLEVASETFDAYDAEIMKIATGFSKPFGIYKRDFGIAVSHEKVEGNPFFLIGFPFMISRDSTGKEVDPFRGQYIEVVLEPNKDIRETRAFFVITKARLSTFFKLAGNGRLVLAFNGKTGSIVSKNFRDIPQSRLFYIGGAKSIRGYKYQYAGPLTSEPNPDDRTPKGGRGFAELETEIRYRINDEWGAVAFVDMGALTENQFIFDRVKSRVDPDDGKLFTGVGLGARYYFADVSPLRLDIAMPLTRRKDIDRALQIYVSFGHSF